MMKVYMICILLSLILVFGCAPPPPQTNQQTAINRPIQSTVNQSTTQPQQTIPELIAQAVEQAFRDINKTSRIAVVNFATGNVEISEAFLGVLEHILVEQRFIVVDRSELDRIRVEQAFQLDWEVDDNTAVNIGRFVGAEVIVTGSVDALRQLRIRVLNTETAVVVGSSLIPLPSGINIEPVRRSVASQTQTRPQTTTQTTTPVTQTPSQTTSPTTQTQTTPSTQAQTTPPTTTATRYSVGETITFGDYEWRVLDVQGNRALIITTRTVARREYHSLRSSTTWADCSLRSWLNGEFYNSFTAAERGRIAQVELRNPNNPQYGTVGGQATNDRIFLLSIQEAQRYFSSGQDMIARDANGSVSRWWLRSPGSRSNTASKVEGYGTVSMSGGNVGFGYNDGVRPALWLNM